MSENLKTWVWFLSVMLGMTLGPVLLASLIVCGVVMAYRRYRGAIGEKLRAIGTHRSGHP